jgi:hypothetical protein
MSDAPAALREFIYLDADRVWSLASQLDLPGVRESAASDTPQSERERLLIELEASLFNRPTTLRLGADFDFNRWKPETFVDGRFVIATGSVRMIDFTWLSNALGGLPSVLKKMNRLEMEALRNSDEGKRMSKGALQQKNQENLAAIAKIEEFKAGELTEVVRGLYTDLARVKLRPDKVNQPQATLVASAHINGFYDLPAALSQKYGLETDAGWTMVAQLNVPGSAGPAQPLPTGNQMEDAFEQIALLMNNAFHLANAPAWPNVSVTPLAIYRVTGD